MRREHARDLFLAFECNHAHHFNAHLFRLILKADHSNRNRLAMGFPEEVKAFYEWNEAPYMKVFNDHFTETEMLKMRSGDYIK